MYSLHFIIFKSYLLWCTAAFYYIAESNSFILFAMRSRITTRSEWMGKDMSKHQIGRRWYYVLQFIQIKKKTKRTSKKHKRWENMLIALRNESSCGIMSIVYVLSLFIKQRNVWRQSFFFCAIFKFHIRF